MNVLRTPDAAFSDLTDFDFAPHYVDVTADDGTVCRMHYVDEGPKDAKHTVFMMHGEPSWSYLYRHMIKQVAAAGHRVLAPDFIGFGKSDKLGAYEDYTYARHISFVQQWFDAVNPTNVTFFGQDWGGLVGLRIVAANMDKFSSVVASNTFLPTGEGAGDAFLAWREYAKTTPSFVCGNIIQSATQRTLTDAEVKAYNAPYPEDSYLQGARAFPALVPVEPQIPQVSENKAAFKVLEGFTGIWQNAFSDKDPVTQGGHKGFEARIPAAAKRPNRVAEGGGHFVQEDCSDFLSHVILDVISEL